jgi:hypothetical protein
VQCDVEHGNRVYHVQCITVTVNEVIHWTLGHTT